MRRWLHIFRVVVATSLVAACAVDAQAGGRTNAGNGQHRTSDLKSSSGGTGIAKGGGNGGTGLPTTVNQPLAKIQPTMTPDHSVAPPPAGPRPHTDLAAAEKRNNLSSVDLIKRSTLFKKVAAPGGDPVLAGAVLGKIGATAESARSFHTLQGFTAAESKGNITPTNGGTTGAKRAMASLSSGGTSIGPQALDAASDAAEDDDTAQRGQSGWLLAWLGNLVAVCGTAGLAWYAWRNMPRGARMTMPAQIAIA